MDHPGKRISSHRCDEQRGQRVLCYPVGYGLLAVAGSSEKRLGITAARPGLQASLLQVEAAM
jgi:hypothetical protein